MPTRLVPALTSAPTALIETTPLWAVRNYLDDAPPNKAAAADCTLFFCAIKASTVEISAFILSI